MTRTRSWYIFTKNSKFQGWLIFQYIWLMFHLFEQACHVVCVRDWVSKILFNAEADEYLRGEPLYIFLRRSLTECMWYVVSLLTKIVWLGALFSMKRTVDNDSRFLKILVFTCLATFAGTKQTKCLTSNTWLK